jgi:hypothetical protein
LRIAVSPTNYTSLPLIEVLIGTASNTKTIIRVNKQTDVAVVATPNIIKRGEMNHFAIRWDNYVVSVHRDGEDYPFIAYTSAERFNHGFYGVAST